MARARARHILVDSEAKALELKQQIADGADFGELAKQHSSCPSGQRGGSLGEFGEGAMVPEFDAVVFSDLPIGQVSDVVQTKFGFHLLEVEARVS
jgi:peptidyl-prolyl cis-trans isomerase C